MSFTMFMSTKLITTTAAGILGVALAAGGAYAATGSLSLSDSTGHVLDLSGVGTSLHGGGSADVHANTDSDGQQDVTADTDATVEGRQNVDSKGTEKTSDDTSEGTEPGEKNGASVETRDEVQIVAPGSAISITGDASAHN